MADGYEFCHKKRCITLFSAPNYSDCFDNAGAFMSVDSELRCSLRILKPDNKHDAFRNTRPKLSDNNSANEW